MADPLAVSFDEKKIDAIFSPVNQCHLPGATVGIAIAGTPVYRKGFGLASMELPLVLTPTTRIRIASVTKQFTAFAYMLLCEESKASIEDPIGKYLPELHPVARPITARQLMGHIGGLRDSHDITHTFNGTGLPITAAQLLSLYRDIDDVNFAPGTAWSYNNGAYLMLSIAMERITGKSFDNVLRERIFKPLGMHDTQLRRWDTDFLPNSASLHMVDDQGCYNKSYLGVEDMGEGGVVSNVDDMLRWMAHMDAPVVGSSATWQAMKTPMTLFNGSSTGYGLGLMMSDYRGVETLSHAGGLLGCNSHMLKVPGAGLDIVILVNRHDVSGMSFAYKILDACLPDLAPVREPADEPLAEGIFRSAKTGRVIQLHGKGGKQMVCIDGVDTQFIPDEQGMLHRPPAFSFYKFAVTLHGDRARPNSIHVSDFGNEDELVTIEAAREVDTSHIVGTYVSPAIGTQAEILSTHRGLRMISAGRYGSVDFDLECLAEGIWRANAPGPMRWGGILTFDEDGEQFRFSTARDRSLIFRRSAMRGGDE